MKPNNNRDIGSTLARTAARAAAKLPSGTFLIAAVGSLAASAALRWAGKKGLGLAGGLIPTLLLIVLYRQTVSRIGGPGLHQEVRSGSIGWQGLSEEPAANISAAATPGVPL